MFHGLFFAKTQVEFGVLSSRFFFDFQALFLSFFTRKMGGGMGAKENQWGCCLSGFLLYLCTAISQGAQPSLPS